MTDTIQTNSRFSDWSSRIAWSTTVAASPTGAAETTIANLVIPGALTVVQGVLLVANAAFTVGTNGVSVLLKIKRSTTVLGTTGAVTATAANLGDLTVLGIDTAPASAQAYTLTMTVASGSAGSAVAAVVFAAFVV